MENKGFCPICQEMILPGQKTIEVKPKHGRTKHYHLKCVEVENNGNKSRRKQTTD